MIVGHPIPTSTLPPVSDLDLKGLPKGRIKKGFQVPNAIGGRFRGGITRKRKS